MKPVFKVAIAVAVVAAAVAAGVLVGEGRSDGNATPPPSTPTSAPPSTPSAGGLVAGAGGTRKADDGNTPIGFASSCDGAAQAAAAYAVSLTDEIGYARPGVAGAKRPGLKATLDYIFSTGGAPDESVTEQRTVLLAPNTVLPGLTAHPEWGGYQIADCVPKFTATINLFSCLTGYPTSEGGSICDTTPWELVWYADDWHVSRIPATVVDPDPSSVFPDSTKAPNPLSAAGRREAIAAGGPGWTEWANAPK
jgi:hypothetical protein